ncbi:MAG: sigma-54-dependent Fis family transcriptional regulator [Deltaproteobacteria bacterium]|nr:sigma-54-dependent Fis family transcriptional regulator [Deltaproteobacteria bacterium]MBW2420772.1 sigma-54-dependent Fis family transcriptional regulator [Deltaproteobacteria bacterium]
MSHVLVVDDEIGVQESLRMLLKQECDVATAGNVDAARRAIATQTPDLILLDLVMPGRNGLELLTELRERGSTIPVVILSATNTLATAVEAMKQGAVDFITKPFELEALRMKVRQLLAHRALEDEVVRLRDEVRGRQQLGSLFGRSGAMQEVFRAIERIARSSASVLVTGESGTGKELVARAIHDLGPRAEQPFIPVNCGAIPRELIESELFGHERGSFTGATERRVGRFEAAAGGTLMLDEIGELDPSIQVKLLRALQEKTVERVGSTQPIEVDVRIIAATNRDLEHEISQGRFRTDLFYRINVVPIHVPPLRERREDVRLLAETFLQRRTEEYGRELRFSQPAVSALERYPWPGNVRELENAVEHGATLCESGVIEFENLPEPVRSTGTTEALRDEWRSGRAGFEEIVSRFERELLLEALERCSWNQTRAATALGITRRLLKLKMDRFELETPDRPRRSPPGGARPPGI